MAQLKDTSFFNHANLIAYYKLENVNDSKASYNLTNNGSIAFEAAKYNNGAQLGTSNSTKYLSINNDLGITNGSISVAFWVKSNTTPASGVTTTFFEHGDSGTNVRYWVRYNNNSGTLQLQFNRQKENVANQAFTYNITLSTSVFTHITLTYDGSTVRGYVNGADVGNVSASGNGASGVDIDYTYIGAARSQTPAVVFYSNAIIDDLAIFNTGLSATEVNNLYLGMPLGGSFLYNFI